MTAPHINIHYHRPDDGKGVIIMFYPFILPGIILAAILLFYGWFNTQEGKPRVQFLIAGGLVLLLLGTYTAIDGLEMQTGEPFMSFSSEDSLVWNDTCLLDVTVFDDDQHFPLTVTPYNYTSVSGTVVDVRNDDGVLYSVQEGSQPTMEIYWNWTDVDTDSGHTLYFHGHYDGNPAHYMSCLVYNYSSVAYQACDAAPADDFPDSGAEYQREWYFGSSDFFEMNGAGAYNSALLMRHTVNAASSHHMYTDYLYLTHNFTGWIELLSYTDCTRDSYNTTYEYDNFTYQYGQAGGGATAGYSQLLSAILLLTGIGLLVGVFDWVRKRENDQPE